MKRIILDSGAGLVALVGVYLLASRKPGEPAGATLGRLAVGTVVDAGVGAVKGVGSVFGIPDTDQRQCQRDLAAVNTWASSFSARPANLSAAFLTPVPSTTRRRQMRRWWIGRSTA